MFHLYEIKMEQKYFDYSLKPKLAIDDFFVSSSNIKTYNLLLKKNKKYKNFLLIGPPKSGKTHLGLIWKNHFNALKYEDNMQDILDHKKNIFIDNLFISIHEEEVFHIINHCNINNLNLLITSHKPLNNYKFNLKDLSSRLKTFIPIKINLPDDELLINLMIKLFHDKQIIIKNPEIFYYIIKRVNRSYDKVFTLIDQIDKLLLQKNKQLTIPIIKELI